MLRERVARHRQLLGGIILFGGAAGVLLLLREALVSRSGDPGGQLFLLVYVAPLVAFGALWARERLDMLAVTPLPPLLLDALVFAAAAVRASGGWGLLPWSGHMLILGYAAVAPGSRHLRLVAIVLMVMTTLFKLVLWSDVRSWSVGLALGLALATWRAALARWARC